MIGDISPKYTYSTPPGLQSRTIIRMWNFATMALRADSFFIHLDEISVGVGSLHRVDLP